MVYQLILSELIEEKTKEVGENIFLENLPSDYEVYLLYYPGGIPNEDLEHKLRKLGDSTGKNLLINIGRLNDPNYRKIANKFNIKNLPIIIVTAIDKLASSPTQFSTAYAKIDSKRLLNSPDLAIECVQKLFNLFIEGKISEAMSQVDTDKRNVLINNVLNGIWEIIGGRDISISLFDGKFEIKKSGG